MRDHDHLAARHCARLNRQGVEFAPDALDALQSYAWPGNVRELENVIERAVALTRGTTIELGVLPRTLTTTRRPAASARIPSEGVDLDELMNDYERGLLLEALEQTRGIKKRAAQLLGITFRSFRYRLEKLGLDERESGGPGPG